MKKSVQKSEKNKKFKTNKHPKQASKILKFQAQEIYISPAVFQPKFYLSKIFSLKNDKEIASKGRLSSITTKGFVFHFKKKDLFSDADGFDWKNLINQPIGFVLSEFEVELHGVIRDLQLTDRNILEIHASYLDKTPHFYKQCVVDLLH